MSRVFFLFLSFFLSLNLSAQKNKIDVVFFFENLPQLNNSNIEEWIKSPELIDECKACIGFLEMRKSDFVKNLGDKLACFKSGRNKLEQEILKEPDNVSFRFLRFIIQEHAPKIVNYHADMNNDLTK